MLNILTDERTVWVPGKLGDGAGKMTAIDSLTELSRE